MELRQALVIMAMASLAYPAITVENVYYGFGLSSLANDTNLTVFGLGYSLNGEAILCTNSIAWAANASRDGALIPHAYLNLPYNGSSVSAGSETVCFRNFTCTLEYLDGTIYRQVTTTDKNIQSLQMAGLDTMMTYRASCTVNDAFGFSNSTTNRTLTLLGEQMTREDIRQPSSDWTSGFLYAGIWLGALSVIYMTLRKKDDAAGGLPGIEYRRANA